MTWNYNVTELAATPLFQARFLIGDTLSNDQQLQDEEINFSLTVRGSIWGAAAMGCASIASQLSRKADTVTGELHTLYSAQSKAYYARSQMYEGMAAARGGSLPILGGISVTEKINQELNPDRVWPNFNIGMQDNLNYPLPPAGNETPTAPANSGINAAGTV